MAIIARNEEAYLPTLLQDIKKQEYPHHLMEVLLIDGESTDDTKQIMLDFQKENDDFYSIKVLDNPKRIQAAGWNVAIREFTGDVLSRIDAHTRVDSAFSRLVISEINAGEMVVGGIRPSVIEKRTAWNRFLLAIETSVFGGGFNKSRRSKEKQYVKTMFHASYRREVFDKVGFFNEDLLRTEDNEMHYRIRQAGFRLCYNPQIMSYQYARSNFRKMMAQKYANGYWVGLTLKICPGCLSAFHLISFLFVLGIFGTTVLAVLGVWQLAALMWAAYGCVILAGMLLTLLSDGWNPFIFCTPIVMLLLHVAYGVGTLKGIVLGKIKKKTEE